MNQSKFTVRPQDINTESNAQEFMFRAMLNQNAFILPVRVEKVKPGEAGSAPMVNVTPLVLGFSGDGSPTGSSQIFNIPVWRLQRGSSALIMDPVVGDIGLMLCCDKDISRVKETRKEAMPGSANTHNESDGIYLGGMLNSEPVQYVKFADDGIDVVSPLVVNVDAPTIYMNADNEISLNAPTITLNGAISQGAGSNAGEAVFANKVTSKVDFAVGAISLIKHRHPGGSIGSGTSENPVAG